MSAPMCGFWRCRGRRAVARVWFPLSKPFHDRLAMDVCAEHLDDMGRMFG